MTRRTLLRAGALSLLAAPSLLGAGCARKQALRVAVQPWCGYQFMTLAREMDLIDRNDVELVPTARAAESVAALRSGQVQAAALTLDEVLIQRDAGLPLSVVLVCDISAGADVVLARPGIDTPSDLRGRRIGIEDSGVGLIMLHEVLRAGGLAMEDVSVVMMDESHVAAWERETLDAIQTYQPSLSGLMARGLHPILDSRETSSLIVDVLAVHNDHLGEVRDALRDLIRGHFQTLESWRVNPEDIAYRMAPLVHLPVQELRRLFGSLELPDATYNHQYLGAPAQEMSTVATSIGEILIQSGRIQRRPSLAGLFDPRFLPSG